MSPKRTRVDDLLVENGLAADRDEAARAIIAGEVVLENRKATSPGELVPADTKVRRAARGRFVSRGGEKLAGALEAFAFDPTDLRCIDIGASTGGFTDCLLKAGAAHVTAVDVGYGDLAWSLRTDERVTVIERTNIRTIDPQAAGAPFDLAVADVSFIPLRKVLPVVAELLSGSGAFITLVKPQFEAPKGLVGQKGVVSDPATHIMVVEQVVAQAQECGLGAQALTASPIKGPEGNIEFLLLLVRGADTVEIDVEGVVESAHRSLS